ncbi:type II toxin-antitoxin system VapC family toxin [Glycomyces sp. YM15]|uniref:type II toxin-antitoxin system VapC family toxin n=1 Tax=Glycomyces sp. YM15 TaxID=2800446 RepID=UPI0027DBCED2|nr:type II toxin-antitoxin system VapC family toxin [Glycomyces sp. YM15]
MIYLDASALLTLVVKRDGHEELSDFIGGYPSVPMATSSIGLIETVRNTRRYGQFPRLMAELELMCGELAVNDEIRDLAADLPGNIRALDAIHVATALTVSEFLTAMVSYDRRMLDIAKEQGLPIASPGMN